MNNGIIYLPAKKQDGAKTAELHLNNIKDGFLSSLGADFLRLLYETVAGSKRSFCFLAKDHDQFVGFASAALSPKRLYLEFFVRHFFPAFKALAPKISTKTVRALLETLMYPFRKGKERLPSAELLSISVNEKYRGLGVSGRLFDLVAREFERRGAARFKIVVGCDLLQAQRFYEKMGCVPAGSIEVHKGRRSKVYVYAITKDTAVKP